MSVGNKEGDLIVVEMLFIFKKSVEEENYYFSFATTFLIENSNFIIIL